MATSNTPSESGGKPPPHCKSIILCDRVVRNRETDNVSILEIFDRIRLPVFPDLANPFLLFLELTEGIGRYRLTLELHDLRDDVVIARVTTPSVEFTERLSKLRVTVPLSRLFLPHAGYYEVVALADGQELGRQKFSAIASEE